MELRKLVQVQNLAEAGMHGNKEANRQIRDLEEQGRVV
jgi:hypothetical protein